MHVSQLGAKKQRKKTKKLVTGINQRAREREREGEGVKKKKKKNISSNGGRIIGLTVVIPEIP